MSQSFAQVGHRIPSAGQMPLKNIKVIYYLKSYVQVDVLTKDEKHF
jgi:hypothetical protein